MEHLIAAHSEDVNSEGGVPDYEGCAPLHAAAQSGYREVADDIAWLLIDHGADSTSPPSPSHHASSPSLTLALTLRVVTLTAPALTPCVVALATRPHTMPAALASLTGGRRCIQHLVYWPWDAVSLYFVFYHPTAPSPSAYEQPAFCDILAIVPRHLAASPRDLQATVHREYHGLANLRGSWVRIVAGAGAGCKIPTRDQPSPTARVTQTRCGLSFSPPKWAWVSYYGHL
ncbi:hypothetical protein BGY98DRAFT_1099506 [Russula aff. rugulosa BPL654]|nr:hypothetical protein BGY98DRAFT_1099506 [Russula aff. rugulosa BPL654]